MNTRKENRYESRELGSNTGELAYSTYVLTLHLLYLEFPFCVR